MVQPKSFGIDLKISLHFYRIISFKDIFCKKKTLEILGTQENFFIIDFFS